MSSIAELNRQVGRLQSALQNIIQQVMQIIDASTTQAASIATYVAKVQVIEHGL